MTDAAALVPDGAQIAFGGGGALMRRPLAFSRALIRHGARELHVHNFLGGLEIDLLIGAGAVASTNCAYLGLLEYGQAPSFQRAASAGEIRVNEYSEFSFMACLHAADLGLPFIPWKTPWGSDITTELGFKTVRDPYGELELLALPATPLDVAVIHVDRVDADGYVELPDAPDLVWDYDYLIARVARTTIVCAEEIAPPRDPARVAIVGKEVACVVHAPGGAWPAGLYPRYEPDVEHLEHEYIPAAEAGGKALRAYFDEYVYRRVEAVDGLVGVVGVDGIEAVDGIGAIDGIEAVDGTEAVNGTEAVDGMETADGA
jgi:glutaconate CoA-transferase, subunit A